MIEDDNWAPAKKLAKQFFPKIGRLGGAGNEALWNGDVVTASTPANLLHEVAHFQIASARRRFKPGYGLGAEPEGLHHWPQLVSDTRAAAEESLASALGILWQQHLGYEDWYTTALSHGWSDGDRKTYFDDALSFLRATREVGRKLLQIGLVTDDGVPKPILTGRWQSREFDSDED